MKKFIIQYITCLDKTQTFSFRKFSRKKPNHFQILWDSNTSCLFFIEFFQKVH